MPTALDNGQRSPRKLLRSVIARLLGRKRTRDMAASEFPRPLNDSERAALNYLLAADFPGVEELREQARVASVVGRCLCGCASVDFSVDREGCAACDLIRASSGRRDNARRWPGRPVPAPHLRSRWLAQWPRNYLLRETSFQPSSRRPIYSSRPSHTPFRANGFCQETGLGCLEALVRWSRAA